MFDQRLWILASGSNDSDRPNRLLPTSDTSSHGNVERATRTFHELQNSIAEPTRVQQKDALTAILIFFDRSTELLGRLLTKARNFLNSIGFNRCLQIIKSTYAERFMQGLEFFQTQYSR